MKFCLASLHAINYQPLFEITFNQNRRLYCEKYGYDWRLKVGSNDMVSNVGFQKLWLLNEIMAENKHDWIFYCGCDTIITNFNITLDSRIDNDAHFVIATDCNGINADSFFIRNSKEGREYLNFLISKIPDYQNDSWQEQRIIINTWDQWKHIAKIVPQKSINSYAYHLYTSNPEHKKDKLGLSGDWSRGDFLLHLVGFSGHPVNHRIGLVNQYINEVIQ